MTGSDVAVVKAITEVIILLGTWPGLAAFGILVLGPWIAVLVVVYLQGKRFNAVAKMYEDNAELLKWHEEMSGDFKDIIIMSTQAMQTTISEVREARVDIKENRFCPVLRIRNNKTVQEPTG